MKVFSTIKELQEFLTDKTEIGFVPTMGALHDGHISLIKASKSECKTTVCSIYVNPTQFNNATDLKNYPRIIEKDLEILASVNCDVVFTPNDFEIYHNDFEKLDIPLGHLEEVLEGKFRPGHFAGVITIVKKLFDIIKPQKAFFGQKDYQQVMVIEKMVKHFNLPIKIIPCVILREKNGLAMSSRNMLLNSEEKKAAISIFETLNKTKELFQKDVDPEEIKVEAKKIISNANLKLEYLEFANAKNLSIVNDKTNQKTICLIAAYSGKIRLIDNMFLN